MSFAYKYAQETPLLGAVGPKLIDGQRVPSVSPQILQNPQSGH